MQQKDFSKKFVEILLYVILALLGGMLVFIGFWLKGTMESVMISIGTSIIASVILYFILNSVLGDPFSPVMEKLRGSVEILDRSSKTGLSAVWKHRAELHTNSWIDKIKSSHESIEFLGFAMAFLPEFPEFSDLLKKKANEGCKIRILLGDPNSDAVKNRNIEESDEGLISSRIETSIRRLRSICDLDNVEIRLHQTPLYCSLYRFDDEMNVTPHLYGLRGSAAPLFCFNKIPDGLFMSYEKHFQDVWEISVPLNISDQAVS
ncbi:hypothetical protein R50345_08770 [Paenibacillus sp. FSL R5-0345]|uniref:DUF5919 domain-containing protein n=1 Tax=Paenibacillus sp. FSL R5-0345 TaxID=1536770 RepID=UPI0004F60E46|nr:DUF5919 domain-containing protein [Paenibacillus sp. FSL R5-0345]AIQ34695.1 hypothetical protein R50345_08770 [Paenibacillus sp. FSL R5-0345]